jgi:lipopolysaccharide transport system permease protein
MFASRVGRLGEMYVLLVTRDIAARYKSSVFGWLWPLFVQLAQLLVFTYLFATIFHVRLALPGLQNDALGYGLWLFTGLLGYNALQIGVTGSATTIYGQANLVKRVVFPLELLPLVPVGTAFIESLLGFYVLIVLAAATSHAVHPTLLLLPLIWIPQLLLTAGLAFFAASLSVFLRDIPQSLGPIFLLFFYLTPIVYPLGRVPAHIAPLLVLNPMSTIVDALRQVILVGTVPNARLYIIAVVICAVVFGLGVKLFERLRPAFADNV